MFKAVYVTKMKFHDYNIDGVDVIPAHVGIVKLKGCHYFIPAVKDKDGCYESDEQHVSTITSATCRRRYGAVPKEGEAYLVEEGRKHINWTRVDEDMYLLDIQGNIVKEN